jgi:hypothetical protein
VRNRFFAALAALTIVSSATLVATQAVESATSTTIAPGTYQLTPGTYTWICQGGLHNSPDPGYYGVANITTCKGSPPTTTTTSPPTTTTTTKPPVTTTTTSPPTTTTTTQPPPAGLLLGSYNGANNPGGATSFGQETGTAVNQYSDYTDSSNECSGNPWPLGQLAGHLGSEQLVISVPLPGFSLGNNGQSLLANNAANPANFDACMANMASYLITDGFSNAVIRLMWEPDSGIYSNDDLTSAANYATVWRDAYSSMMGVSGAHFQWAWYWGGNFDSNTNNTAWPGDPYVTTVTFDQYDQSWSGNCGINWGSTWTASQSNCIWSDDILPHLNGALGFAQAHSKPVSIGEWGVINRGDGHGGLDDPQFINNMISWLKAHAAWESYFNFNSGGDSVLSDFPNSLAAFQADKL